MCLLEGHRWADVDLTDVGRREAAEAGQLIAKRGFANIDLAFTSELHRANETCEIALKAAEAEAPTVRDFRFNERHYGCVQGVCKHIMTIL